MKATRSRIYAIISAIALGLLLAGAKATASTNSIAASIAAPTAIPLPAKTALTPAVPMTAPVSRAGEDIRDIRQPRHLPTPWFWIVVATGVVTFLAVVFVARKYLRRGRDLELSAEAVALARLAEARRFMDPEHAREYCFAVSKIIRGYVENRLHIQAPRLTTEEFLREFVEAQGSITGAQRALLVDFLEHCDLAKFAGWHYSQEALSAMHEIAVEFVRQSTVAPTSTPAAGNQSTSAMECTLVSRASALTNTTENAI